MEYNYSSFSQLLANYSLSGNERANFSRLYQDFLVSKRHVSASKVDPITIGDLPQLADLPQLSSGETKGLLSRLVVVKLNGGLGTSMGCSTAKSAIEVRDELSFLDIIARQITTLQDTYNTKVPLVLVNSFNTHAQTLKNTQKYSTRINFVNVEQSKYPRIEKDSLIPLALDKFGEEAYYPPGHGDVFETLYSQKLLNYFVQQGREYMFIANSDNLGATVDVRVLKWLIKQRTSFLMEVTPQTRSDIKGGFLVKDSNQKLALIEMSPLNRTSAKEFASQGKSLVFNTNNIWVHIPTLIKLLHARKLHLPIIINHKTVAKTAVIQLETAMGTAISCFKSSQLLVVERDRFLPVKNCSDLFLLQSNLFALNGGTLTRNKNRISEKLPLIHLGEYLTAIDDYKARIKSVPDLLDLDLLTLVGDVSFSDNVTLRGNVIIVANTGQLKIPEGAILNNQVLSGNLKMGWL